MTRTESVKGEALAPLTDVAEGVTVRLAMVDAGHGLQSRLAAMGLVPGTEVRVVSKGGWGPFIVAVKGSRVMLGRGMTDKIYVTSV
jgi:Fe2+ transport system protein FeoA